jgi:hypothetical protein
VDIVAQPIIKLEAKLKTKKYDPLFIKLIDSNTSDSFFNEDTSLTEQPFWQISILLAVSVQAD